MNPPLQTIRLSKQEVDILNSIKRRNKINNWNILCRMAFCRSCSDPSIPPTFQELKGDSNVEIDWSVFAGDHSEIYTGLVIAHAKHNGQTSNLSEYFYKLLFRGIRMLKYVQ